MRLLYCCVKQESSGWEQLKRLFSSCLLSGRSRKDWLDFYMPWLWQWRVPLLLTQEKHFCFNAPGFTATSEKWGWRSTRNHTHDLCVSLIAGLLLTFLLRQQITTLTLIIFNHSHAAKYSLQSVSVFSHIWGIWCLRDHCRLLRVKVCLQAKL